MGDTIYVKRDPATREPLEAIDVIFSPDDKGWWFSRADFKTRRGATSKKLYPSREAAMKAYHSNKITWEWH